MYDANIDSIIIGRYGDPGITFLPNYDVIIAEDADPPNEGRVGIGTNSPIGKLHVVGRADTADIVAIMPGRETANPGIPDIKMGIGTIDPQSKLQIVGGYLQLDVTSGPPVSDCDSSLYEGRMKFDPTTNLLYICSGTSGWVSSQYN